MSDPISMDKKGNWLAWVIVAVLAIGVGYYFGNRPDSGSEYAGKTEKKSEVPGKNGTYKIGAVFPLTGDGAAYGEPARDITRLAIDEINKEGGVNGMKLEVIYEDGKCNGKDASSALQKLISIDKVQAVFAGACSSEALAMVPIGTQNKVVLFSPAASSPDLTGASKFFFRDYPSDASQGKVLAAEALKRGWKKIAFMQEKKDYPLGIYKAFSAEFEKGGGVLIKEEFASDSTDFRSQLKKLQVQNPDALFIDSQTSATGGRVLKQLKESKWKPQLFLSDAFGGDVELMKANAPFLEGALAAEFGIDENNQKFQHLLTIYKDAYKKDVPYKSYAQTEYDAPYILRDGIKAVGYNGEKLAEWSRTITDWEGASGKVTIEPSGDRAGGHIVKIVHSGVLEILK